MQSVTDNLKASLAQQTPVYNKQVLLRRRYWTGTDYAVEAVGQDITAQVLDAGRVFWKLDKEGFNNWTVDNVTLTLRNDRNQWKQDNPVGFFPSGYLVRGSAIEVKFGAQLADGSLERPYVFRGTILTDPIKGTDNKDAVVTVTGQMAIFDKYNAEEISTLVTRELLGSGSGTTFTTDFTGVGVIIEVLRGNTAGGAAAAYEIKNNVDFTIENLAVKGATLKVVLKDALTGVESLWISYRYFYTDKTFKWVVEQVAALAGITDTDIKDAAFQSQVLNSNTWTSQADWETATRANIDTTSLPGSWRQRWRVIDDFTSLSLNGNVTWDIISGPWQVTAAGMTCAMPGSFVTQYQVSSTIALSSTGTWEIKATPGSGAYLFYYFHNWAARFSPVGAQGFMRLEITGSANGGSSNNIIVRSGTYTTTSGWVYTASTNYHHSAPITVADVIAVTRAADGAVNVYLNGSVVITWAGPTSLGDNAGIKLEVSGSGTAAVIRELWKSEELTTTTVTYDQPLLTSAAVDATVNIKAWGSAQLLGNFDGAVPIVSTYTSDAADFLTGNDPAGWVATDNAGGIKSAVKRYIKVSVSLPSTYITNTLPAVDFLKIVYFTDAINISILNTTGMTCTQLLDSLAQKCNYERGFTAAGKFIFRPRSSTLPAVMALSSATNVVRLININDGADRVYNLITATCGDYTNASSAASDAHPNSVDKYDTQKYDVPTDSLLPAENVNLAYAITPTILAYTKTARKRCQAVASILPQLELGDKVTLTWEEPTAFRSWTWGDNRVLYGDANICYYDEAYKATRVEFSGMEMRVEGIEFDWWNNKFCLLDLVEVV